MSKTSTVPVLDMTLEPKPETPAALPATVSGEWTMPSQAEHADPVWRDAYFATQLANVTALHIYGKPLAALKPVLRTDIRSFADSYAEDAIQRYAGILNAVERMHE